MKREKLVGDMQYYILHPKLYVTLEKKLSQIICHFTIPIISLTIYYSFFF